MGDPYTEAEREAIRQAEEKPKSHEIYRYWEKEEKAPHQVGRELSEETKARLKLIREGRISELRRRCGIINST
jgi:hypothetical protein